MGLDLFGTEEDFAETPRSSSLDLFGTDEELAEYVAPKEIGSIAKQSESGGRADIISTGKGDFGGKSYGAYQLSSNVGTLGDFIKQSEYADEFKGLKETSKEFDHKWKELSKLDDFNSAQKDYITKQNYAPVVKELKSKKLDVDSTPKFRELVYSTAVQYGPSLGKDVINGAFKGEDISNLTEEQLIQKLTRHKVNTVNQYFKSSSAKVRNSLKTRWLRERKDALNIKGVKDPVNTAAAEAFLKGQGGKGGDKGGKAVGPLVEGLKQAVRGVFSLHETYTGAVEKDTGEAASSLFEAANSLEKIAKEGPFSASREEIENIFNAGYLPDDISVASMSSDELMSAAQAIRSRAESFDITSLEHGAGRRISEAAAESKVLAPKEFERAESGVGRLAQDIAVMAPTLASTVGLNIAAPGSGLAYMGASIAGGQAENLKQQDVEYDRAFKASVYNALAQMPLESIGLGKISGLIKGSGLTSRIGKKLIETMGTEFVTEFLQKHPEAITEIWATTEGKTDKERLNQFVDNYKEIFKEAVWEGTVGAVTGGAIGAGGSLANKYSQRSANDNVAAEEKAELNDAARQVKEMQTHKEHMQNLLGREVTDAEAMMDWTQNKPENGETLSEMYREKHPFEHSVNEFMQKNLPREAYNEFLKLNRFDDGAAAIGLAELYDQAEQNSVEAGQGTFADNVDLDAELPASVRKLSPEEQQAYKDIMSRPTDPVNIMDAKKMENTQADADLDAKIGDVVSRANEQLAEPVTSKSAQELREERLSDEERQILGLPLKAVDAPVSTEVEVETPTTPVETKTGQEEVAKGATEIAEELNLTYNGLQEGFPEDGIPNMDTYTVKPEDGAPTTFMVPEGSSVEDVIAKRDQILSKFDSPTEVESTYSQLSDEMLVAGLEVATAEEKVAIETELTKRGKVADEKGIKKPERKEEEKRSKKEEVKKEKEITDKDTKLDTTEDIYIKEDKEKKIYKRKEIEEKKAIKALHGTTADVASMSDLRVSFSQDIGMHVTEDRATAENPDFIGDGGKVLEADVELGKTIETPDMGDWNPRETIDELVKQDSSLDYMPEGLAVIESNNTTDGKLDTMKFLEEGQAYIREELVANGYDAIAYKNDNKSTGEYSYAIVNDKVFENIGKKASQKPTKTDKAAKTTQTSPEVESEAPAASKAVVKKFVQAASGIPGIRVDSEKVKAGQLVVSYQYATPDGAVTKQVVIPEDISGSKKDIAKFVENEKAKQDVPTAEEAREDIDIEKALTTYLETNKQLSDKSKSNISKVLRETPSLSKSSKNRQKFSTMSLENYKKYLSEDKNFGKGVELVPDNMLEFMKNVSALHGPGVVNKLNQKNIFKATDVNIRSRAVSEDRISQLEQIADSVDGIEADLNNDYHKELMSNNTVNTKITLSMPMTEIQKIKGLTDEQTETILEISSDPDIKYNAKTMDKLIDMGAVNVVISPNETKTKFAPEGIFTTALQKLKTGGKVEGAKVSFEKVTGEGVEGLAVGDVQAAMAADMSSYDVADDMGSALAADMEEQGYDVDYLDPEISSSFGLFMNKGYPAQKGKGSKGTIIGVSIPLKDIPARIKETTEFKDTINELQSKYTKAGMGEVTNIHSALLESVSIEMQNFDMEQLSQQEKVQLIEDMYELSSFIENNVPKVKQIDRKTYEALQKNLINQLEWDGFTKEESETAKVYVETILNSFPMAQVSVVSSGSATHSAYSSATDMVKLTTSMEDVNSLVHELGHYYYRHFLTPAEKRAFQLDFVNSFENADQALSQGLPFPDMAGQNLGYNPSEYFAEAFSQQFLSGRSKGHINQTMYQKVLKWFRKIWADLKAKMFTNAVARDYVDLALSRKYEDLADRTGYFEDFNMMDRMFEAPEYTANLAEARKETGKDAKADDKKPDMQVIAENAILEESIQALPTAKDAKEAQNHFIDYVVYKMTPGPIRKNMLKTVAAIEKIGDEHYKHAMKVVEKYEDYRLRNEAVNSIKKLVKPSKVRKLSDTSRAMVEDIMKDYDLSKLTKKKRDELVDMAYKMYNDDPRIATSAEQAEYRRNIERLEKQPLSNLSAEVLGNIKEDIEKAYALDKDLRKRIKAGKEEKRTESALQLETQLKEDREPAYDPKQRKYDEKVLDNVKRTFAKGGKTVKNFFLNAESIANILDKGRTDGAFTTNVINPIMKGQDEALDFKHKASDEQVRLIRETGVDITNWSYNQESGLLNKPYRSEVKTDEFTLDSGETIKMSRAEQVGFARLVKDQDGLRHVLGGGLAVDDKVTPYKFTSNDVVNTLNKMSPEIFEVAKAVDRYYEFEGEYLNDYSIERSGFKIADKPNYHPIIVQGLDLKKSDADFNSTAEILNRVNARSTTPGSIKKRQAGAKNAVQLEDVFASMARTAHDAGIYVGLSGNIPDVKNFLKDNKAMMYEYGMQNEYGTFNKWVDLIGSGDDIARISPELAKFYNAVRKMYTTGALSFRASTAFIQEVSAFNYLTVVEKAGDKARVAARIPGIVAKVNAKFAKNKGNPESVMQEAMSKSPLIRERVESAAIDRDLGEGGYEAESRRTIQKLANRSTKRKLLGKLRIETGFAPIVLFDSMAIQSIWETAKWEASNVYGLQEGSKGYWNKVVERSEEVIRQTQPTSTKTDKSAVLNTPVLKEFTYFASQRSKLANMAVRAMHKIKEGKVKEGIIDLAYISLGVSASVTAIKEMWRRLRGKEEKDEKELMKEMAANNVGNFPIVGSALGDAIRGYKPKLGGAIAGEIDNIHGLYSAIKSKDEEKIEKAAKKVLQGLGAPMALEEYGEVFQNLTDGEYDD